MSHKPTTPDPPDPRPVIALIAKWRERIRVINEDTDQSDERDVELAFEATSALTMCLTELEAILPPQQSAQEEKADTRVAPLSPEAAPLGSTASGNEPSPAPREPIPGFDCHECGHRHANEAFAFICVGCPCPVRRRGWLTEEP